MAVDQAAVTVTAMTHRGAVREGNEDALVVGSLTASSVSMSAPMRVSLSPNVPAVVAVADGLGGHAAGEVAASHTVQRFAEQGEWQEGKETISELLRAIDAELQEYAEDNPDHSGLGTTIAGLLFAGEEIFWFNVGDSRAYRLHPDKLQQLSQDDSPAVPGAEPGTLAAVTNLITQSLGGSAGELEPHVGTDSPEESASWLLCSDGLSDLVEGTDMVRLISEAPDDSSAVTALWKAAMDAGGRDNISIALVRMG
ncbi:PP2C family protein-serine/threonine phosphatase [Allonocardiopsis opalescens]|uniref:Serine/threonine protein phosphatase PrpC n=1 Tax=Allonocardiopsis opalescens TaxID=1144618 RepID=A0A2T0Q9P0_9ACTN|nr:protein phosphatase 2C domain-containing protein [Allonocardiopsis opalescens]PRY00557.1 serine/threonine protein phosphatase PrpC [Allonocardiopsis opalescens]